LPGERNTERLAIILTINQLTAPLKKYENSPSLQAIKARELYQSLAARGVEVVGDGPNPDQIRVSLRSLALSNGSIADGQRELMAILGELSATAVSLEAADLEYINGPGNIFSHATARGLESQIPCVTNLLTDIACDDEGNIPLFDRIDRAEAAALSDPIPEGADADIFKRGAERDLIQQGYLTDAGDYRAFLEPEPEVLPELPADWRADPLPYKSIFDRSDY
jgi:hypothetical protein